MANANYKISYTIKRAGKLGHKVKLFKRKADAKVWLNKNLKNIYSHQLIELNPKSKLPKYVVSFEPDNRYTKKVGTLKTHFETGMECLGLIFYEDGVYGSPNPDFDPNKPEDLHNFKYYSSHDGITYINHGQIIKFPDGNKFAMFMDGDFAKRDGYRLSFYPAGFSRSELIELFGKESVKVTIWIPINKHAQDLKKFIRGQF